MKKLSKHLIWAMKTFLRILFSRLKIESSFIRKYFYFIQFSKKRQLIINCKDYEECKLIFQTIPRYPGMGFIKEQLNDNPNYKARLIIYKEIRSLDNLVLKTLQLQYKKPILKMKLNISDNGLKDVYDFDDSSMYPSAMITCNINGV